VSIFFYSAKTFAQDSVLQLVSASGESFVSVSLQLDWSLGEIETETFGNSSNTLSQGFHQNSPKSSGVFIRQNSVSDILVYPNPFNSSVYIENLNVNAVDNIKNLCRITDISGKTVAEIYLTGYDKKLNLNFLKPGSYFLLIYQNNKPIFTKQLIKY
jgi:hypothetical protein